MSLLIACDPGTKYCSFAIFRDRNLESYIKLRASLENIRELFSGYSNEHFIFAIEDQYLSLNVHTLIRLVSIRSMVTTLARVSGCSNFLTIPPQKWQLIMLGVNIKAKRKQRKKVSCMVASQIAKQNINDNDIADAICIGDFVCRKKLLEEAVA